MTIGRIAALTGIALGVMVANVAVTFLYMAVYGHAIIPATTRPTMTRTSRLPGPTSASSEAFR